MVKVRQLLPLRVNLGLDWPDGLCARRGDHMGHPVETGSLAPFWCTGREADREPGRSERRRGGTK